MTTKTSTTTGNTTGNAGGSTSNVNLTDEDQGKGEPETPNIPKDAVGNYDADHAAPGGYNVPPSYGPAAGSGMPAASKETNPDAGEAKDEDQKAEAIKSTDKSANKDSDEAKQPPKSEDMSGHDQQKLDALDNSAGKEQMSPFSDEEPIHGDQGKPGLTPGDKAASVTPDPVKSFK